MFSDGNLHKGKRPIPTFNLNKAALSFITTLFLFRCVNLTPFNLQNVRAMRDVQPNSYNDTLVAQTAAITGVMLVLLYSRVLARVTL